jgi:ABC-type nitrate/sulfonate/bicarbonate transport system substrate-binding protein
VAADRGHFQELGIDVSLVRVSSSGELRDGLLGGQLDIIHATVDDLIAWRDASGADIVGWMGGTSGPIALAALPSITAVADLRGEKIGVDDPRSGFVSLLRRRLRDGGLRDDDVELLPIGATRLRIDALREARIAATMLSLPFSLQARDWGATILHDGLDDPPAAAGVSKRAWLERNGPIADAYFRAVRAALAWFAAPGSVAEPSQVLARLLGVDNVLAGQIRALIFGPARGWPTSGVPDLAAFEAAWRLRSEMGDAPTGQPGDYLTENVYSRVRSSAAG